MKIIIINMAESTERRAFMEKQFSALGLDYEFFTAVNGKNMDFKQSPYDDKHALCEMGRPLLPAEVGCFASHSKVWQKCIDMNQPIIVLEDDLTLRGDFSKTVRMIPDIFQNIDYLRLAGTFKKKFKIFKELGDKKLIRFFKGPSGAQAYALTPRAAKRFLDNSKTWVMPVDDYMDCYHLHKNLCIALHPYLIESSLLPTTIQPTENKKIASFYKIKREINRLKHQVLNALTYATLTHAAFKSWKQNV